MAKDVHTRGKIARNRGRLLRAFTLVKDYPYISAFVSFKRPTMCPSSFPAFRILTIASLAGVNLCSFACSLQAETSARHILAAIQARKESIQNIASEVIWVEYNLGRESRWEQQQLHADSLRRIRLLSRSGSFEGGGNKIPDSCDERLIIFDGEKTYECQHLTDHTEEGILVQVGSAPDGVGYLTATIHDGCFPEPDGPWARRNPLAFVDEFAIQAIGNAVSRSLSVSVEEIGEGVVVVTVPGFEAGTSHLNCRFEIDMARGCSVLEWQRVNAMGLVASRAFSSHELIDGVWFPVKGKGEFWSQPQDIRSAGTPDVIDWSFEVLTLKVNDPGFSDDVFAISPKRGTLVNDMRFKVNYRIGIDEERDRDLDKAVSAAIAKKRIVDERMLPSPGQNRARVARWATWGILAVLCILTVGVVGWRLRNTDQ